MLPRKEIPFSRSQNPDVVWRTRLEKSGSFIAVLILNLAIFLVVSSAVIYHFVVPTPVEPMVMAKIKVVPPPPTAPSHGGEAAKALTDPTPRVVPPPVAAPSIVISSNPLATFSMHSSNSSTLTAALPTFTIQASGSGMATGSSGGGMSHANPFGGALSDGVTPALVGYFYDLKQTSDANPQPSQITQDGWKEQMLKVVAANLDENILDRYLKSPEPRSTGSFAIAEQASENAPDAFGLGDKVQPNLWAVVYHGKAIAPEDMKFRFVGFGDDTLVVRANQKYVLDAGWQFMLDDPSLHETYPNIWSQSAGDNAKLRIGKWITVSKGDPIDLDILIGDWGGLCGFFLLIEVDGVNYQKTSDGTPILPLFQVGSKIPMPTGPDVPPISDNGPVWAAGAN